jgi:DNA sulfur modification protein DndD
VRLVELQLVNFRQFFGTQKLVFAEEPRLNVTVIHGFNGAGKTALLNSFIWCLYGETTPDLDDPDKLVNERAMAEAKTGEDLVVSVRLRYVYGGLTYIAERKAIASRDALGEVTQSNAELSLFRIEESGEQERIAGCQLHIDRQLPCDLYPFFFFNGERVETLAKPTAYERVENGVKTLLDVEIYERSMRHLKEGVSAALSKELKVYGSSKMQELVDQESELNEQRLKVLEELKSLRKNLEANATEIEKIEQAQASIAAIQEFTTQRKEARNLLDGVERDLRTVRIDCARCMSRNGYLAFSDSIFSKAQELVLSARKRGELPAKVKPQFVDDLLGDKKCICGRPITKSSPEEECLEEWKKHTGLAELEECISHTNASIMALKNRKQAYFDDIDRFQGRESDLYAERRRLNDKLEELRLKIGDKALGEEPEDLELQRQRAVRKRDDYRLDVREEERRLDGIDENLALVAASLDKVKSDNEKVVLVQRQKQAVTRVADALDKIYKIQKDDVRTDLSRLIGDMWTNSAVKAYTASVSSDFRLVLTKEVRGNIQPVRGASTGEKQVLALAFVGSLVKKARTNFEDNKGDGGQGVAGGDYPLVMDSPFGSLEKDYQRKVAEWIPLLASQVVMMVSQSQWEGEAQAALASRIGKEYILELRTPKDEKECTISLRGREYPYVSLSDEPADYTVIQEVR